MRTYLYDGEAGFEERREWFPDCWVNVQMPDAEDFEFLVKELHVPDSFLEDIADKDERPRTETDGDWRLTILRIPVPSRRGDEPYITVPIGIIFSQEVLVSVCCYQSEMFPDFIKHAKRRNVAVHSKFEFIFQIIYASTMWFLKYLEQINQSVTEAEKKLEKSIRNEDLLRLMRLQKSLVYFNTSLRGNDVMIGKMRTAYRNTDAYDADLVEDVLIEMKQAYDTVNIYSDILVGTMDTFASIISNNVNAIMKRMTSLSITLMIPTLIASFYGMNVNIHVGDAPHAFWWIILVSAVLSSAAFVLFRKIKWF